MFGMTTTVQQGMMMQVVVPPGLGPGHAFAVQTPNGPMQVTVPHGIQPTPAGTYVMNIQVPPVITQQQVPAPQMVYATSMTAPANSQAQSPAQPAAEPPKRQSQGAVVGRSGPSNQTIMRVDISTGMCNKEGSELRQLASTELPRPLKEQTGMSDASWELANGKLREWQDVIGPCPEAYCLFTGGCCCCCLPCLVMQYTKRASFEKSAEKEINEMLAQYKMKIGFEKEGEACFSKTFAKFSWL